MSLHESAEGGFKARAGAFTLFFLTSDKSREELLGMLERAFLGGLLPEPDPELWEALDAAEAEDFDPEESTEIEELDLDVFAPFTTTSAGTELLFVAFNQQRWLKNCPRGPLDVGMLLAGDAMAALICGWSATVIHGLAAGPRTLAQLNERVDPIGDLETLEEHVAAMERTGLVESYAGSDGKTRYAVTDWLREGIAQIGAAARQELHHPLSGTWPPDRLDVEAAFQLALPLISLPEELSGSCQLSVQLAPSGQSSVCGVTARVEQGRVVPSEGQLEEQPETWMAGSTVDWLDTVIDPSAQRLEVGGDRRLAEALIQGLYERLYGVPVR